MKREANKVGSLQPSPKVLVSCRGLDGEENALAVAYCGNCSFDPPMLMVGIVPERYSYKLIKESGCFVVNIPDKNFAKEFQYLGSVSKRDEDKLVKMQIKRADGKVVPAPLLSDCPVNIECTIVDSIMTGSHEMFVGKVEYVHVDETLLTENGDIDFNKIDLL